MADYAPNSAEPIRFEINNHVTKQLVDTRVMCGEYRRVVSHR